MHPVIDEHRAEIAELCRSYGVRRLELFGSAALGAEFDPSASDADFLVDFEAAANLRALDQFFGLARALEDLLGRPVDMVEAGAIKNPFMLAEINRGRELIYAA